MLQHNLASINLQRCRYYYDHMSVKTLDVVYKAGYKEYLINWDHNVKIQCM